FRASYANLGTEESPRVGTPRMSDGLKFLDKDSDYTPADLFADNTKFTISNVKDGKLGPFYTNIKVDRKLTKDDVFNYYKLSSIGKPSNQEIEIFQLFKDEPVQTGTVGWVGVGNMSNNVFIPYYPLLLEDQYEGYQVSTQVVTQSDKVPEGFHTWTTRNDGMYVEYPRTGETPSTSPSRAWAAIFSTPRRSPASPSAPRTSSMSWTSSAPSRRSSTLSLRRWTPRTPPIDL
ncbi:hypothetical protein AOA80_04905, partial [Methanomassiliicoccales archaeon RumEn M1]